jgi:hypothetical protein
VGDDGFDCGVVGLIVLEKVLGAELGEVIGLAWGILRSVEFKFAFVFFKLVCLSFANDSI